MTALREFRASPDGQALMRTSPTSEQLLEGFRTWAKKDENKDKDSVKPLIAGIDTLTTTEIAAANGMLSAATVAAAPATADDRIKLAAAFDAYMASPQGMLARQREPVMNDAEALESFSNWMNLDSNRDNPAVRAARPLMGKMTAAEAGIQFREGRRRAAVDAAVDEFLKSPDGQNLARMPNPPQGAELMRRVQDWVNREAATKPEIARLKPAVDESVANSAMATADAGRMQGKLQQLRATFFVAPAEEEDKGFFGNNSKGLIGGLIAGVIGMFVGGPIGALLGALIGFAIGGSQDKGGLLSGLFNPEPASPRIAKPITRGVPPGKAVVLLRADGSATQDYREADRMLVGRIEGRGENGRFIIEGMAMRQGPDGQPQANGVFRRNPDGSPVLQPASGSLAMTRGNGVDVTAPDVVSVINTATAQAQDSMRRGADARNAENTRRANEAVVLSVAKPDIKQAMESLQKSLGRRLDSLNVKPEERSAIAAEMTRRMADPAFRRQTPQEQMDALLAAEVEVQPGQPRRKIGDMLASPANGGAATLEAFRRDYAAYAPGVIGEINKIVGPDGLVIDDDLPRALPPVAMPVTPDETASGLVPPAEPAMPARPTVPGGAGTGTGTDAGTGSSVGGAGGGTTAAGEINITGIHPTSQSGPLGVNATVVTVNYEQGGESKSVEVRYGEMGPNNTLLATQYRGPDGHWQDARELGLPALPRQGAIDGVAGGRRGDGTNTHMNVRGRISPDIARQLVQKVEAANAVARRGLEVSVTYTPDGGGAAPGRTPDSITISSTTAPQLDSAMISRRAGEMGISNEVVGLARSQMRDPDTRAVVVEYTGDTPGERPRKAVLLGKQTAEGFVVSAAVVGNTVVGADSLGADDAARTLPMSGSNVDVSAASTMMQAEAVREAAGRSAPSVGGSAPIGGPSSRPRRGAAL